MGRRTYAEEHQMHEAISKLFPADGDGMRWVDLKHRASKTLGLSPSTLSRCLKKAVDQGSIERTVDSTAHPPTVIYRVTSTGKAWLSLDPALRRFRTGPIVQDHFDIALDRVIRLDDRTSETGGLVALNILAPVGEARVDTETTLFVDKKHAPVAKEIVQRLDVKRVSKEFVDSAYRALHEIERGGRNLSTWREEVDCTMKSLDAELAIMIRFDGRKFRSRVDWGKEIQIADQDYRNRHKELAELRAAAQTNRQRILESFVMDLVFCRAGTIDEDTFRGVIEWWTWGDLPNPPTEEEIEAIIQGWVRNGLVELHHSEVQFIDTTEKGAAFSKTYQQSTEARITRRAIQTIYYSKHGGLPPYRKNEEST